MTMTTELRQALEALAAEWDVRQPRYGAHREAQAYEDGIAAGFEAAAEELRKLLAAGSVGAREEACDGDGRCTNPRCPRHGIDWDAWVAAGSVGAGEDGTVTP